MRQVRQKTHISSHGKRMYELSIYSPPDLTDHRDAPAIVGKQYLLLLLHDSKVRWLRCPECVLDVVTPPILVDSYICWAVGGIPMFC